MHFHVRRTVRYFCSYQSPAPCHNEYKFKALAALLEIDKAELVNIINDEKLDLGKSCVDVMEKNVHYLLNSGFDTLYIKKYIRLIDMPSSSLKNKLQICEECGCFKHEIGSAILNFNKLVQKRISSLKESKIIPADTNLIYHVLKHTGHWEKNYETPSLDSKNTLRRMYGQIYDLYLKEKMPTFRSRCEFGLDFKGFLFPSLTNFQINADFMNNNLQQNIPKRYKSILFSHSLSDILELKQIPDLKKLILTFPGFTRVPAEVVKKIFDICEKYKVDFSLFTTNDCKIFSLDPDEFESRLRHCVNSDELKYFKNHPNISKLIRHYDIVQERLKILQKLDMKCFSLNLLSYHDDMFWRHVKKDTDAVISNDAAILLHKELKKPLPEIKKQLLKHPFCFNVPVFKIMANVDFLRNQNFSDDEIFRSIQILLYPSDIIERTLSQINNENIAGQKEDRKHHLALALYYIDRNQESVFSDLSMKCINDDCKVEENQTLFNIDEEENLLTKV